MSLSHVFQAGFTVLLTLVIAHSLSSRPRLSIWSQRPLVPSWTRLFTAAGSVGGNPR